MTKLYELTGDMKQLEKLDIDSETFNDTLDGIMCEFNDKAVAILSFAENIDGDIASIDDQIKRLKDRKQTFQNRKERLRQYLLYNMEKAGITKIECPYFTASIRKGSESVVIEDESLIPDEYITVSVSEKADKAAIKRDIKSGKGVAGASIKRGENTIIIK